MLSSYLIEKDLEQADKLIQDIKLDRLQEHAEEDARKKQTLSRLLS